MPSPEISGDLRVGIRAADPLHFITNTLDVVVCAIIVQQTLTRQAPLLSAKERFLAALQCSEYGAADSLLVPAEDHVDLEPFIGVDHLQRTQATRISIEQGASSRKKRISHFRVDECVVCPLLVISRLVGSSKILA